MMLHEVAPSYEWLRDAAIAFLDRTNDPEPAFTFEIGWCSSYDELFRGDYSQADQPRSLAQSAIETGRVLLSARGGAAKTVVLRRLARRLLNEGWLSVVIDVRQWSPVEYDDWRRIERPTERMDLLLDRLGPQGVSVRALDALSAEIRRVIFVDGLNEVTAQTGQDIIDVLEHFVRYGVNTGVVVADRLARRELRSDRDWRLATVLPLQPSEIKRQLISKYGDSNGYDTANPAAKELLQTPYFLDLALRDRDEPSKTSAGSNERLFREIVGLSTNELDIVSEAAFEAYRTFHSRSFPFDWLEQRVGTDVMRKLLEARAVLELGGTGSFKHHLEHDFLAARFVVKTKDWLPAVLTEITFNASSFDVLSMALQQIDERNDADLFVRKVYDWNLYGSAYAITEGRAVERDVSISAEMLIAILAMLTIRKWDLMIDTRRRAIDALALFPRSIVQRYLDADEAALFAIVDEQRSDKAWFVEWKKLFAAPQSTTFGVADMRTIASDDILGWTFANVLRRVVLSSDVLAALRERLGAEKSGTVRWRISHVLGRFPTKENAKALLQLLNDDDRWVRFGATRALVETAARGSVKLRRRVVAELGRRAQRFVADDRSIREFQSAIFVDENHAPSNWFSSIGELLETLYSYEPSIEKREGWLQVADRFKAMYGSVRSENVRAR